MIAAIAVSMLGLIALWTTWDVDSGIRQIGPIVGVVLIVTGIWYYAELLDFNRLSGDRDELVPCTATEWHRLGILAIALISYVVLLQRAGFVIASTVLIVVAAYGFGSQRLVRDTVSALVVSTAVMVTFDLLLGVRLPDGILSSIK